jgi:hypothetical protein
MDPPLFALFVVVAFAGGFAAGWFTRDLTIACALRTIRRSMEELQRQADRVKSNVTNFKAGEDLRPGDAVCLRDGRIFRLKDD